MFENITKILVRNKFNLLICCLYYSAIALLREGDSSAYLQADCRHQAERTILGKGKFSSSPNLSKASSSGFAI